MQLKLKRALVSVSDKTGLETFAKGLADLGVELISTSGTAAFLQEHGLSVTRVEDLTGLAEMLDGRVKTLHPKVHGALLARRDVPSDAASLAEHGIDPIDLLVVNLYPFVRVSSRKDVEEDDVIEAIDIGGPAMIRAAAKNHANVGVVVDPERYGFLLDELGRGRRAEPRHPPRARRRGLRPHRGVRHRDRQLVPGRRELPRPPAARVREGHRPAVRREPAPASRLLPRRRRP